MTPHIVEGKKIAEDTLQNLVSKIQALPRKPRLAVLLVGDEAGSLAFVSEKRRACERIGIGYTLHHYPATVTTSQLRQRIARIRQQSPPPDALILQLPLPPHLNTQYLLDAIPPEQDADMLSTRSLGLLLAGKSRILPPTPAAILEVLRVHQIPLAGTEVVLVGWGRLVGKPLSVLLLQSDATVTVLNEYTRNLSRYTTMADILVSAVGKPDLIRGEMVREGVVALDAGFSKIGNTVCGDFHLPSVSQRASIVTPVPGGIGPITVAMLLGNVVSLAAGAKR